MGAIGAIAGGVLSIGGQYQASKSAENEAAYQAQVDENNQILANMMADDAIVRGKESVRKHRENVKLLKGKQTAGFAKAGVTVDKDSALDVLLETTELGELDALVIEREAEREAHGFRSRGLSFGAEAAMGREGASNIQRAGTLQAAGTALTTASTVADRWRR